VYRLLLWFSARNPGNRSQSKLLRTLTHRKWVPSNSSAKAFQHHLVQKCPVFLFFKCVLPCQASMDAQHRCRACHRTFTYIQTSPSRLKSLYLSPRFGRQLTSAFS
jgi:hypothetical protein